MDDLDQWNGVPPPSLCRNRDQRHHASVWPLYPSDTRSRLPPSQHHSRSSTRQSAQPARRAPVLCGRTPSVRSRVTSPAHCVSELADPGSHGALWGSRGAIRAPFRQATRNRWGLSPSARGVNSGRDRGGPGRCLPDCERHHAGGDSMGGAREAPNLRRCAGRAKSNHRDATPRDPHFDRLLRMAGMGWSWALPVVHGCGGRRAGSRDTRPPLCSAGCRRGSPTHLLPGAEPAAGRASHTGRSRIDPVSRSRTGSRCRRRDGLSAGRTAGTPHRRTITRAAARKPPSSGPCSRGGMAGVQPDWSDPRSDACPPGFHLSAGPEF